MSGQQKPLMEPSRNLFENVSFFGLTYSDFLVGTFIITGAHKILIRYHHELFSFALGGLFFFGMSHLRLHTRERMIADTLSFHLTPTLRRLGLTPDVTRRSWLKSLSRLKRFLLRVGLIELENS